MIGKPGTSSVRRRPDRVTRVQILPSQQDDVDHILEVGLRDQDAAELEASGVTPKEALDNGLEHADALCMTIKVDSEAVAMFGVCPSTVEGVGIVWMLGTEGIFDARRELVEDAPLWMDMFNKVYPIITNYVDARNTVSIAWLEKMGYDFPPDDTFETDEGITFRRIVRCASPSHLARVLP